MADFLIYFLLLFETIFLCRLDRKIFGTWITPFNLLALPYLIVVTLAITVGPLMGFYHLYMESVIIWIVGLAVFWVSGSLPVWMLYGKYLHKNIHRPISHEDSNKTLIMILAWFCIFASIYGFRVALSKTNITMLGTDEFFDIYARGWYAHARVFSYPLLIYYIGTTTRKNVLVHITIAALFLCIAILQVKSWLIIPLLAGLLYRIASGRLRVTPAKILIFVAINYFIFNLAYLISFIAVNPDNGANSDTYLFLLKHFFGYLFAGVLGLSEQLRIGMNISGSEWSIIFAPFVNLHAVLTGKHIITQVSDYWVATGTASDATSNVHTFFGTLYIYMGPIMAAIYTVFLSFFSNLYYAYALSKRNCWLLIGILFVSSLLGFGWFDFYFFILASIEVPVFAIILFYLSRLRVSAEIKYMNGEYFSRVSE